MPNYIYVSLQDEDKVLILVVSLNSRDGQIGNDGHHM
jgi:hypothetical protein